MEVPNIKFHEYESNGSLADTLRHTDGHDEAPESVQRAVLQFARFTKHDCGGDVRRMGWSRQVVRSEKTGRIRKPAR